MKIVSIFVDKLFAFIYKGESENELSKLLEKCNDPHWLYEYAKKNGQNVWSFTEHVMTCREELEKILLQIKDNNVELDDLFTALHAKDWDQGVLIFQKGKLKNNILRLYALKIDSECYVITGGAIKMSQTMQGHPDTAKELEKLANAKAWLKSNGVIDDDSFYEFLNEAQ